MNDTGVQRRPPVGALRLDECERSARIHRDALGMEFLARFGLPFLAAYHRAWVRSPAGLALAARDDEGNLVGVLLGSLDPAAHYRAMLRNSGPELAVRMVGGAALRPHLAKELAVTRAGRYSRALWRHLRGRLTNRGGRSTVSASSASTVVGEVTHLMVDPAAQRSGAGRTLIDRTTELARAGGLAKLVLVTPPDLAARSFYEALGWVSGDEVLSKSGERFVSYTLNLSDPRD